MPELPEVETTRRGIEPLVRKCRIERVEVRHDGLRQPVPGDLSRRLQGGYFGAIARRGKYLLVDTSAEALLVHLGMSGSLRVVDEGEEFRRHDHVIWHLEDGRQLRFHDPRRFGIVVWAGKDPGCHPLLEKIGPEPLDNPELGEHLHLRSKGRKILLRDFLLDSKVVAGVGNIYASEAAWRSGIRPDRSAGRISRARYEDLALRIQEVLQEAVEKGGTTLRDFVKPDGEPGYFQHHFSVYDREGENCERCEGTIRRGVHSNRSFFYCPGCQH